MATFQFQDTNNQTQTVDAQSANQALQNAQNISQDSGVIEVKDIVSQQNTPTAVPAPQTSVPLDRVESFDDILARTQSETDRRIQESREDSQDILGRLLDESESDTGAIFESTFASQGGDKALRQLQDESTRLAEVQGKFRSLKQRISGGEGQSKVFEAAQLSEVGRQEAIEVGNQALLVQALQGNVATARQIAMDTVDFTYKDKQLNLQALGQQLDVAMQFASQDQQRALNREQTIINKELNELERTRTAIDTAISSGEASVEEMQQLTNPNISDSAKRSLAQSIQGRAMRYDRSIQKSLQALQLDNQSAALGQKQLQRKLALIELAKEGDAAAINELGYDPSSSALTIDELKNIERTKDEVNDKLGIVRNLIADEKGIELTSGALRGKSAVALAPFEVGRGVIPARDISADFLKNVKFITDNLTFDKLLELKSQGATFGALSENELKSIANSASELNAGLDYNKKGQIVGFTTSEQSVKESLKSVESQLLNALDLQNQRMLSGEEFKEINNI